MDDRVKKAVECFGERGACHSDCGPVLADEVSRLTRENEALKKSCEYGHLQKAAEERAVKAESERDALRATVAGLQEVWKNIGAIVLAIDTGNASLAKHLLLQTLAFPPEPDVIKERP